MLEYLKNIEDVKIAFNNIKSQHIQINNDIIEAEEALTKEQRQHLNELGLDKIIYYRKGHHGKERR